MPADKGMGAVMADGVTKWNKRIYSSSLETVE